MRPRWGFALLLLAVLTACEGRTAPADSVGAADEPKTTVVDSVLPMDVALDRFRADLAEPDRLRSGADSRDALVRSVVDALAASDTAAFEALAVNRAEWAWLYFPWSAVAKPPYELPAALAWFQAQERNRRGVLRALRDLGGHALNLRGYTCDPEPAREGANRIWTGCAVTLSRDGGDPVTLRLFGGLLERDGRFAVLSYSNDF
jgi:hypothetical protein